MTYNECFDEFLQRTGLAAVYNEAISRHDYTSGELFEDATLLALFDAFEASKECAEYNDYCKREEARKWEELKNSSEGGTAVNECEVTYKAGTTGIQENNKDTITYCSIDINKSAIAFYKDKDSEGTLIIAANGNGELRCLIDVFKGLAKILEEKL